MKILKTGGSGSLERLGMCMSMSACSIRAEYWSKGENSASCLGVLLDYKLPGVHWYQVKKWELSIFSEGSFSFIGLS